MSASPPTHRIQDRDVTMPVVVRDASSGTANFLVDLEVARRLVDAQGIEPEVFAPGRAMLSLALIDYRDNDLGDYHEFSIAFFVRESAARRGVPYLGAWLRMVRGRVGTFIRHLPVDQSFTCEAGRSIWGFPKTVQEVDIAYPEGEATCRLVMDGRLVLSLAVPRAGDRDLPESELVTYSVVGGSTCKTPFTSSAAGFGVHGGKRVRLELGDHPIADELRALGLPKKALSAMWMESFRATFGDADPLR